MKPSRVLFISKEGISTFWFFIAAGAVVWSGFYARGLLVKAGLRPQFLIMTNSDVTQMVPETDPQREDEIALDQTRLAMDSIFNKSGTGLDAPDRCQQLLSKEAWEWVQAELVDKQSEAFRESRMHQKVEIENIELHRQRAGDAMFASVQGQLIRAGVLDGKLFNEVWAVRAELMWTRNLSLRHSGRIPTICSAFTCREAPVASTLRRSSPEKAPAAPSAGAAGAASKGSPD